MAAALAGARQLRQFPNLGLWGCVRQEAPLLYVTNLQVQVRTENFSSPSTDTFTPTQAPARKGWGGNKSVLSCCSLLPVSGGGGWGRRWRMNSGCQIQPSDKFK